jgi:hypothetical protein
MIRFVDLDDWICIYNADEMIFAGHSIHPEQLLELLKIPYEYYYMANYGEDDDYSFDCHEGKFSDIPKRMLR